MSIFLVTRSPSVGGSGNDNPDGLDEATTAIMVRNYNIQNDSQVVDNEDIARPTYGASEGYGPSGGYYFTPDPVTGSLDNEGSAGWSLPWNWTQNQYEYVCVSYMLKISQELLDEIEAANGFWGKWNKFLDFKYYVSGGDHQGNRNTMHFGRIKDDETPLHAIKMYMISDGANRLGPSYGPDWRDLGDEWVWVAHVIDMRGATAAERYMATYIKRNGDAGVTRIGRVYESEEFFDGFENQSMTPYNGEGILGFFGTLWGYWDDMNNAENIEGTLSAMKVWADDIYVTDGWFTESTGGLPPF